MELEKRIGFMTKGAKTLLIFWEETGTSWA